MVDNSSCFFLFLSGLIFPLPASLSVSYSVFERKSSTLERNVRINDEDKRGKSDQWKKNCAMKKALEHSLLVTISSFKGVNCKYLEQGKKRAIYSSKSEKK